MAKKKMVVHKIPSKFYSKIIEVNAPIRFYWVGDDFDGIEFEPLKEATPYQLKLLNGILEFVMTWAGLERQETPIPDYILRAFKDKEDKGEIKWLQKKQ